MAVKGFLTRPEPGRGVAPGRLRAHLEELGVIEALPTIHLTPANHPFAANELMPEADFILLSSPAAVEFYLTRLFSLEITPSQILSYVRGGNRSVFCPGKVTYQALCSFLPIENNQDSDIRIYFPEQASEEIEANSLVSMMRQVIAESGFREKGQTIRIFYPRGNMSRHDWVRTLQGWNVEVNAPVLYTNEPAWSNKERFFQRLGQKTDFLFFSSSAVTALCEILGDQWNPLYWTAWCIGQPTARRARETGFSEIVIADEKTEESLLTKYALSRDVALS